MAIDIQAVFPQETITISSVAVVEGTGGRTVDIIGEDFSSVDTVEINEIDVPAYVVISRTLLQATLPSGVTAGTVRTVTVLSRRLVMTQQSILRFRVGKVPGKLSGILRLAQLFLKVLFTRPGSDIFAKQIGGAGLRNLGRSFSKSQSGSIVSDFVVSVQNTTRQIIAIQSRQPKAPNDEKLLNARVVSSQFSVQESALLVTVELTSHAGRSALLNVVV